MKASNSLILVLGLIQPLCVYAQGTFRNLDFELSQIPQTQPPGSVMASLALPFWTVYFGAAPQSTVLWEELSAGSSAVTLCGPNGTVTSIAGGYSALLFGGDTSPDVSIRQTGIVPANAESLLFKAQVGPGKPTISVSLGGQTLPLMALSTGANYTLYGANIAQFAGLQEELRFSAAPQSLGPSYWNIDDIVFSTAAVPEPTTSALLAVSSLTFAFWMFRRRKLT